MRRVHGRHGPPPSTASGGLGDPGFQAWAERLGLPVRRYLARALVDDSAAAARLFDDLVGTTEQYFTDPPPGFDALPPATRTPSPPRSSR